ncbi:hypothetical protein C2845_PM02G00710 [Panicum miliaceum]|uniref:Uncharacterized protein n=1 Tax=Panicum miliaceum TaxID=4540 RepID=A0A3L6SDJ5_PANMI|nr:hypothetical protein C2845_PM02G00710 [Panicum miliaceum]
MATSHDPCKCGGAPPPASRRPPCPTLNHYNRLPGKAAAVVTASSSSSASAGTSSPPLLHWKRKDRKHEILRLREVLKLVQDGARWEEMESPVASCRCHFFDGCGGLQAQPDGGGGEHWVDAVLRRRFLRLGVVSIGFVCYFMFLNFVWGSSVLLEFDASRCDSVVEGEATASGSTTSKE